MHGRHVLAVTAERDHRTGVKHQIARRLALRKVNPHHPGQPRRSQFHLDPRLGRIAD